MQETGFKLGINIDRYDKKYLKQLGKLLSKKYLIQNAQILKKGDKHYGRFERKISIQFCGLSGLSIIGGSEKIDALRKTVIDRFIGLISNKRNFVGNLNKKHKIYLDVKLLFVYPYSDFKYDIIQAETTRHDGVNINDQKSNKEKYLHDFHTTQRLTEKDLANSKTYQHLLHSLDKVQEAVNASDGCVNNVKSENRVIVKFCPINISSCFLKINHNIFIDPYVLSKSSHEVRNLALISPISTIEIPEIPNKRQKLSATESKIYEHYCSLLNHFEYLWYHPLTLYSTDATAYTKGRNNTLREIRSPKSISYLAKSQHLKAISSTKYEKSSIDLWRQHCKNELLRYCSKFLKSTKDYQTGPQSSGVININPISIFIVGAWKANGPSNFMNKLEQFIRDKFSKENKKGLELNPIKIDAESGTDFRKQIFEGLNSSQLAIVVQTADNPGSDNKKNKFSRPNVYIEKGYLMGRLGKKYSRSQDDENQEPVFIFIEEGTEDGSDTNHITQTRFANEEYFNLQFFKIVKWLWEITELNSDYAINILDEYKLKFDEEIQKSQDQSRTQILQQFKNLATEFRNRIDTWERDYQQRMELLF